MYESQHYVLQVMERYLFGPTVGPTEELARITMKREFGKERVKAREAILITEADMGKIDQRFRDSILAQYRPFDDSYVAERDLREKRLDIVDVNLLRDADNFSVDLRIGFVESIPYFDGFSKYRLATAPYPPFAFPFQSKFEDFSQEDIGTFSSQFGIKPEIVGEIVDLERRLKSDMPDFREKYMKSLPSIGETAHYMDKLRPMGVKVEGHVYSAGESPMEILVGVRDGEQVYFVRRNGEIEFAECGPKALLESQIKEILSIMKRHDTDLIGIKRIENKGLGS